MEGVVEQLFRTGKVGPQIAVQLRDAHKKTAKEALGLLEKAGFVVTKKGDTLYISDKPVSLDNSKRSDTPTSEVVWPATAGLEWHDELI